MRILQQAGYEVAEAVDGTAGLDRVRALRPGLVLLDVVLPDLSGQEVLRQIRADPTLARVSVILLSSVETNSVQQAAGLDAGADDYIPRPVSNAELLARVRAHFRQRELTEQLRASEHQFSTAFAHAAIGMALIAPAGRLLKVNRALGEMLGYSEKELLTRTFYDLTHPDDRADDGNLRQLLAGEIASFQTEKRYLHAKGQVVWGLLNVALVRDEAGRPLRQIAQIQDITMRRHAEEESRRSESELRRIAEELSAEKARLVMAQAVAKVGSWETELKSGVVRWSEETHRIFETDPVKFPPTHQAFLGRVHPDDRRLVDQAFVDSRLRREPCAIEHRLQMPDGRVKIVEERWQVLFDEENQPLRAVGTCQDITARKQSEAELHESEARLFKAFSSTPVAVAIHRFDDRRLVEVNPAFSRLTGWNRDEVLGRTNAELNLVAEETRVGVRARVLQDGAIHNVEIAIRDRNGESRDVLMGAELIELRNVPHTVTTFVDITERKRMEGELRRSEASLAHAQRLARMGHWELDIASDELTWSDEVYKLFGREKADFVANFAAFMAQVHPEDTAALGEAQRAAVTGRAQLNIEHRIILPDGTIKHVHELGDLTRDPAGRPSLLLGTVHDITERKLAELELRAAEQQLHVLIGRLHSARELEAKRIARELHDDLGQKLTALNMELAGMERNGSGLSANQQKQIARMHGLVDQTIEVVQTISGELRLSQLDVLGLAAAVEWYLQEFARRSGIPCRIARLDETSQVSDAQSTTVFRILQEALTNIARHAGASEVVVSLETEPGKLVLRVGDNGRGITAAELGDRTSLGLLGMRERAHLVGGEVSISAAPDRGTSVVVRVPLARAVVLPP